MKRTVFFVLIVLIVASGCSGAEELLGSGREAGVVPAGEAAEYSWGALKALQFHRPTAFQVLRADLFTGVIEDRPASPATGAEFVSIELEFTCAQTETICDEPPQALLELQLADGRTVEEGYVPMSVAWMGDEEVVGGGTVTGWITFEVPADAEVQALRIIPYDQEDALQVALPAPTDGFSIEFPWQTNSDGSREQELPAFRRDLEQAGYALFWAGLLESGGKTGLFASAYTDELFFFDDAEAVAEAQELLLAAADLWPQYGQGADYLAVNLGSDLSDEIVATVGADAPDIEAFLDGSLDQQGFIGRWWVLQD